MGLASLPIYLLVKTHDFSFVIKVCTIFTLLTHALFSRMVLPLACYGGRVKNDERGLARQRRPFYVCASSYPCVFKV